MGTATKTKQQKNKDVQTSLAQGAHGQTSLTIFVCLLLFVDFPMYASLVDSEPD